MRVHCIVVVSSIVAAPARCVLGAKHVFIWKLHSIRTNYFLFVDLAHKTTNYLIELWVYYFIRTTIQLRHRILIQNTNTFCSTLNCIVSVTSTYCRTHNNVCALPHSESGYLCAKTRIARPSHICDIYKPLLNAVCATHIAAVRWVSFLVELHFSRQCVCSWEVF